MVSILLDYNDIFVYNHLQGRRQTRGYCRENGIVNDTPEEIERKERKLEEENIQSYPFAKFYGDVKYCTTLAEISIASDQLLYVPFISYLYFFVIIFVRLFLDLAQRII